MINQDIDIPEVDKYIERTAIYYDETLEDHKIRRHRWYDDSLTSIAHRSRYTNLINKIEYTYI
jgi:hypothetical protein